MISPHMHIPAPAPPVLWLGQGGEDGPAGSGAAKDDETGAGRTLNVLIVEDELLVAWHLEAMVRETGASVCGIANDRDTALAIAEREEPDLILMDVNLGDGPDGVSVAAEVSRSQSPRFLFVTAYDPRSIEAKKSRLGVEGRIMGKPVDARTLGTEIQKAAASG